MQYKLLSSLVVLVMCIAAFGPAVAQPAKTPPVVTGPQTLSGFGGNAGLYEFLTQGETARGDIGGISTAEDYWVYIVGIDASGVTGPDGRQIQFNLQNTIQGETEHLGISFSLDNPDIGGFDLLECYQSNGGGLLTHGLVSASLDVTVFDLRFNFSKDNAEDGWTVTPYYRLSGGSWTPFSGGSFTGNPAFDFDEAKLTVFFTNSIANSDAADGQVVFDNFFVLGPIPEPITVVYVDDAWQGLAPGDAVQFPGEDDVRVMGVNAFATIQEGIDSFIQMPPAALREDRLLPQAEAVEEITVLDLNVAPGTYQENVVIPFPARLLGSGSGSDPLQDTIIEADPQNTGFPVIDIAGFAPGGVSVNSRLEIRDLRVTGAVGSGDAPSGISITADGFFDVAAQGALQASAAAGVSVIQFMTFNNVTAVDNSGHGIAVNSDGIVSDLRVVNCEVSNNSNHGIFISSSIASFDSLIVDSCTIEDNGITGITSGPQGSQNVDNIHISNSTLSRNGDALSPSGSGSGDISLFDFNSDASITNVDVTGNGAHIGIQIRGVDNAGTSPAGNVQLDDVTISGQYQHPNTWVGSGLFIANFSSLSSVGLNNVQIDVSPVSPSKDVINLYNDNIDGSLDIGNMQLGGNADLDILNSAPASVDANDAVFTNAADNFEIEDRIFHGLDDNSVGLVRWTGNQIYLTATTFSAPDTAVVLDNILSVVDNGDTLNFGAGNYYTTAGAVISKSLTFFGGAGVICRPLGATSGAWVTVDTLVTLNLDSIIFDGAGYDIGIGCLVRGRGYCRNLTFRNIVDDNGGGIALWLRGDQPVEVSGTTFSNIGGLSPGGSIAYGACFTGTGVVGSTYRGNTYVGRGAGAWVEYGLFLDAGAQVNIVSNTFYNLLGFTSVEGVVGSAGICVVTNGGGGTSASIDSSTIYDCYNGIKVGEFDGDQSFAIIRDTEIYQSTVGLCIGGALFVKAEDNDIHGNGTGVVVRNATVFDLDRDRIQDNDDGIIVENSFGEIDECIISNNSSVGLSISDESSTGVTVHRNEFCTSGEMGMENLGQTTVDATTNWWGDFNGPGDQGPGNGDGVGVGVDYSNFETSSLFVDSPCSELALCENDGDVNNSGSLTALDALAAFSIGLNGGTLPAEFDEPGFECEVLAADVNCNGSVTALDALDIFERALAQLPPSACFAGQLKLDKVVGSPRISLLAVESGAEETDKIRVALAASNSSGLRAFSTTLKFPAERVDFLRVERSEMTSDWAQLDGKVQKAGELTVAGFNVEFEESSESTILFTLVFKKKDEVGPIEIELTGAYDELAGAIWERTVVDGNVATPEVFALRQNYPNPFNPETLIEYDIPSISHEKVPVRLTIYNVKGQIVRTLVDAQRSVGAHKVKWDGRNDHGLQVPSGAYFYTIKAGDFKDTKRMMLVK